MKNILAIYGQARDTLEVLVWELTHRKTLENGLTLSPQHESISPIFDGLKQVQKLMKH